VHKSEAGLDTQQHLQGQSHAKDSGKEWAISMDKCHAPQLLLLILMGLLLCFRCAVPCCRGTLGFLAFISALTHVDQKFPEHINEADLICGNSVA
jgi:hypothetical protein